MLVFFFPSIPPDVQTQISLILNCHFSKGYPLLTNIALNVMIWKVRHPNCISLKCSVNDSKDGEPAKAPKNICASLAKREVKMDGY